MPVKLRGKKWHFRYQIGKQRYSGVCHGCGTKKEAEAYEAEQIKTRTGVEAQRSVKALVENYRHVLTGGKAIRLDEAFGLSLTKPVKREPSAEVLRQKTRMWSDFLAYMKDTYPDAENLTDVTRAHCEGYVRYLADNGRYIKEVTAIARRGGKRKKAVALKPYETEYLLSPRTIKLYCLYCAEVFHKLSEDAGLISNPWTQVVMPKREVTPRDIFSEEELEKIKRGLESDPFCKPLFIIAAATGLTEGDICMLKWNEVSFGEGLIKHVRRKTGVYMEIPMILGLSAFLRSLPRVNDYVLPEHAAMYDTNNSGVSYRIKEFLHRLGIETRLEREGRRAVSTKDLHSMRHVFCYYAGMAGIPLATVQSIVGHMTPEMTRHYQRHVTSDAKRKAAAQLPEFLSLYSGEVDDTDMRMRKELSQLALTADIDSVRCALEVLKTKKSEE